MASSKAHMVCRISIKRCVEAMSGSEAQMVCKMSIMHRLSNSLCGE